MSKNEIVHAYLQGRVSRRMFIRGLVAAGVSVTAAVTYSEVLSAAVAGPPRRVGAQHYGDHYNPPGTVPPSTPLPSAKAASKRRAQVASAVTSNPSTTG